MPYSEDVEKKIKSFYTIEDIINAMKAYAGVTMRKTEQIVPNVREYEKIVLSVISDLIINYPDLSLMTRNGGNRIIVAFGSSQGLCGAYNEKVAAAVADFIAERDVLFVIGKRLTSLLDLKHIIFEHYIDSVLSISGIQSALEKTVFQIMDIYRKKEFYNLTFIFTSVFENKTQVIIEQILPPDVERILSPRQDKNMPFTYLDPEVIFARALEELLYISFYRCHAESLRSENWYRMRSMEGASEILKKHIVELSSLQKYIRQEEITEEMLEILGSGMFYG
ncbi:MAG TPA: F0F1 ATP synthase subunit gamma [Thermodesulfovibrionales bacterium]|nr:F0F1 ATP synthase subunit gamma [Thermodesulfovibrionales bacterium]